MDLNIFANVLILGLIYGLVSLGVFISFRILDFPDLTVDSSFVLGGAISAMLIVGYGMNSWLTLPFAFIGGCLAGLLTAWLHLRFNILNLLASILTMLIVYSLNIFTMGIGRALQAADKARESKRSAEAVSRSFWENIDNGSSQLFFKDKITTSISQLRVGFDNEGHMITFKSWLNSSPFSEYLFTKNIIDLLALVPFMIFVFVILLIFLRSEYGLALRAVGANKRMAQANGIHVKNKTYVGMALSNGLVALGGLLYSHLIHSSGDVSLSVGVIVSGLAGVIIGETIFPLKSLWGRLLAVLIGSTVYRLALSIAIQNEIIPIPQYFVKAISAIVVALALIIPYLRKEHKARQMAKKFKANFEEGAAA